MLFSPCKGGCGTFREIYAYERGEYGAAKQLLQESLNLFRELGNQQGIADSLEGVGFVTMLLGEYTLAKQLHQEDLALSREVGDHRGIASSLVFLARVFWSLEEYGQAQQLYQEGLAIFQEIGHLREVADVFGDLGEMANDLGDYTEAIQLAQECLTIARKIDHRHLKQEALKCLGDAACGLGDLPEARRYHHQALEIATTLELTYQFPNSLVGIAALLAAEGEKERALELLALVIHHHTSWHWTKYHQAAPLIAELEAELPPDVVAAAWERGRARDLETTVDELLAALAE